MSSVVLNINTKFRNNYDNTESTDFIYNLPYQLKNVTSMEYLTSEFSNAPYTINNKLSTNNFVIVDKQNSNTRHTIVLQEGNYPGAELAKEINRKIDLAIDSNILQTYDANNKIVVTFDTNKKKFNFDLSLASGSDPANFGFDLDFTLKSLNGEGAKYCSGFKTIDEKQLTLGWIMGFRKSTYAYSDDFKSTEDTNYGKYLKGYSSEGVYDRNRSRYFLLLVNDYNNSHKNTLISSYQKDTMSDNNILTKFKYFVDPDFHLVDSDTTVEIKREYSGKVDINRLQIRLLDEFGRIVDLDNMDYSLSLKFEIAQNEKKN